MEKIKDQNLNRKAIKIVLLGDTAVGKTAIGSSYVGREFEKNMIVTIGTNKNDSMFTLKNGKQIKLILYDSGGAERFHSGSLFPLRRSQGAVIVFDVTRKSSFEALKNYWVNQIKENAPSDISK